MRVPEAQWTKQVDFLCNCHGDCCLILSEYVAAEGTGNVMQNVRPYSLNYDKDACIKCGQCVDRCPMSAISFGDDGGALAGHAGFCSPLQGARWRARAFLWGKSRL